MSVVARLHTLFLFFFILIGLANAIVIPIRKIRIPNNIIALDTPKTDRVWVLSLRPWSISQRRPVVPNLRPESQITFGRGEEVNVVVESLAEVLRSPPHMVPCSDSNLETPSSASVPSDEQSPNAECVEVDGNVRSCGGCANLDTKFDCTSIAGASSVSCVAGTCLVLSCEEGFVLSNDARMCIPI